MLTGNGLAVKGVFESKKSSLIMAHFSAENGLLFKVVIEKSRVEGSLMEQDTIENILL